MNPLAQRASAMLLGLVALSVVPVGGQIESEADPAALVQAADYATSWLSASLELLRIREASGEISPDQRQQDVRSAIESLRNSPISASALDRLRAERAGAADRMLARAESLIAAPRWPPDDSAASFQYWSRFEINFARWNLGLVQTEGGDLTYTLRPVANVIGWAQGRLDGERVFDGIDEEIAGALTETFSKLPLPPARSAVASAGTAGAGPGVTTATGATTRQPPPPSTNPPPRGGAGGQSRTIQVAASAAWTATGVVLDPGVGVEIEASGTIEAAAPSDGRVLYHQVPPGGRAEFHSHLPQAFLPALSLLGRIGNGPVVPVGLGVRMLAAPPYGSGELFLGINDDGVGDNSGAWTVRITILGGGAPPPRAAPPPLPPSPLSPPPPPPPVDTDREWTPWLNRDDSGGLTDWETLSEHRAKVPCGTPTAIECRATDGRDWRQTGQRYKCSLDGENPGGICANADNGGACLDYEVRFRCPQSSSDGRFARVQPAGDEAGWTRWLNRDNPLDSADFEGLSEFAGAVPCQKPIAVECRTVDGRDWSKTGQRYTCSLESVNPGGICINSENPGGCLDYEVRFRCP